MHSLTLLPAVDVTGGQAVRLTSGRVDEGSWGSPAGVVHSFHEAGATWVHLVDLDLAFGRGDNAALLAEVIASAPLHVELSGGIRTRMEVEAGLRMGAARVNVATQALTDIDEVCRLVADWGQRVAVCLDVRGDRLAPRGGAQIDVSLWDTVRALNEAGVARLVVTDVERDGAMSGTNMHLLGRIMEVSDAHIIASGGVASAEEIKELRALGVEGAIIGKALYQGAFTFAEALEAAGEQS